MKEAAKNNIWRVTPVQSVRIWMPTKPSTEEDLDDGDITRSPPPGGLGSNEEDLDGVVLVRCGACATG